MQTLQTGPGPSSTFHLATPHPYLHEGPVETYPGRPGGDEEESLAAGLGWLGIGLGLTELLAPRSVGKLVGVGDDHTLLVRALGLRELASGAGILTARRPGGWLWSRVGGDAMDLALLGLALSSARAAGRNRVLLAALAVGAIAAADIVASRRQSALRDLTATRPTGPLHLQRSLAVNRAPQDCYRFWRAFENLPRFMEHLVSVSIIAPGRSHWVAKGPAGTTVEWDAEVTRDEPDRLIAWRSLEGADVDHSGVVRFEPAPGNRGTIVRVELRYSPPAGQLGAWVARLFGEEPEHQIREDLRRFKQVLEAGEIPTTVGQPSGRRSLMARFLRKGQPG